ncbi:MAG TPA: hypothetical protein VGO64_08040, partial [Candidatus Limnocylindrales bacterium]|nr:hypothetical protein [Candidatus Limnocylindrales bacterium]
MVGPSSSQHQDTLIGRDQAIQGVVDRLATSRLVTLTGLGGIGKTALADEVGRRHRAGGGRSVMVDLVSIDRPNAVPAAIASLIGATDDSTRDLLSSIIERLTTPPALLVL